MAYFIFFLSGLAPFDFFLTSEALVDRKDSVPMSAFLALVRGLGLSTQILLAFVLKKQRREVFREHLCLRPNVCWKSSEAKFLGLVEAASWPQSSIASGVWRGKADRLSHQGVISWLNHWLTSQHSVCKRGVDLVRPSSGTVLSPQGHFCLQSGSSELWGVV